MRGICRHTGSILEGAAYEAHLIEDILTTQLGERQMLRGYGSRLPKLMDKPMNDDTILDIYAESAEAILKWAPWYPLVRVTLEIFEAGKIGLKFHRSDDGIAATYQLESVLS